MGIIDIRTLTGTHKLDIIGIYIYKFNKLEKNVLSYHQCITLQNGYFQQTKMFLLIINHYSHTDNMKKNLLNF